MIDQEKVSFSWFVGKAALDQRVCKNCKWRSDDFTSACVNGESEHCADFVSEDDRCEKWEEKDD